MQFKEIPQYDISCTHADRTQSIKDVLSMLRVVTNGNLISDGAKVVNTMRDTVLENIPTSIAMHPYDSEILEGYSVPPEIQCNIQPTVEFDHDGESFFESVCFYQEDVRFSPDSSDAEQDELVVVVPMVAKYTMGMGDMVSDLAFKPGPVMDDPLPVLSDYITDYVNAKALQTTIRGMLQAAPAGSQYQIKEETCQCCNVKYLHITGRYHALAFQLCIHLGAKTARQVVDVD